MEKINIIRITKKNIFLFFLLFIFICCKKESGKLLDPYLKNNVTLNFSGKKDWIKEVKLYECKRADKVNSFTYLKKIASYDINYYEYNNRSDIFIKNMNFHNDFKIIIESKTGKFQEHQFSKIIIQILKSNPFDRYEVTGYTYNGKAYVNDECNFELLNINAR